MIAATLAAEDILLSPGAITCWWILAGRDLGCRCGILLNTLLIFASLVSMRVIAVENLLKQIK